MFKGILSGVVTRSLRQNKRSRRGRMLLITMATSLASFNPHFSYAQTYNPPTPMPKDLYAIIDEVSEADGSLQVSATDIYIGPDQDSGAISLNRTHRARMGDSNAYFDASRYPIPDRYSPFGLDTFHNLQVYLTWHSEYLFEDGYANVTLVVFGKTYVWRDVLFRNRNYILASDGSGAFLKQPIVNGETFAVLADGTEIRFQGGFDWTIHGNRASLIKLPNGENFRFSYQNRTISYGSRPILGGVNTPTLALTNIESSKGWGLSFYYGLPDPELGNVAPDTPVISQIDSYSKKCPSSCSRLVHDTVKYFYELIVWNAPLYALKRVVYNDGTETQFKHQLTFPNLSSSFPAFRGGDFSLVETVNRRGDSRKYTYTRIDERPNWNFSFDGKSYIIGSVQDESGATTTYDVSFPDSLSSLTRTSPDGAMTTVLANRENQSAVGFDVSFPWNAEENGWYSFQWVPGYFGIEASRRPISSTDQLGRETKFRYDRFGRVIRHEAPEGNIVERQFDLRGNVIAETLRPKPGSLLTPLSSSSYFPLCNGSNALVCNKPLYTIDNKSNRTDYEWSSVHGQLIKKSLPPDTNGVRPVITFGYSPFSGVDGGTFFLLTSTVETISPGVTTNTTYEYDTVNNFVLKSSVINGGGSTLRTCYGYDAKGNKISETSPRANLSVCP